MKGVYTLEIQNDIVNKIFELMKLRGLNAKQVSIETGISQSSFTEWKKGRAKPKTDALIILSKYFGIPLEQLTGIETPEISPIDAELNAEMQQLSDDQKKELLKYAKFLQID